MLIARSRNADFGIQERVDLLIQFRGAGCKCSVCLQSLRIQAGGDWHSRDGEMVWSRMSHFPGPWLDDPVCIGYMRGSLVQWNENKEATGLRNGRICALVPASWMIKSFCAYPEQAEAKQQ